MGGRRHAVQRAGDGAAGQIESSHVFLLFLCGEATPEAAQPSGKRRSRVAYMADRKGRGRLPGIGPLGVASPARLAKGTVPRTHIVETGGVASQLGVGAERQGTGWGKR